MHPNNKEKMKKRKARGESSPLESSNVLGNNRRCSGYKSRIIHIYTPANMALFDSVQQYTPQLSRLAIVRLWKAD